MNGEILRNLELEQIQKLTENKEIPSFRSGDTLLVTSRTPEGNIEKYEGLCIRKRNKSVRSNFTVRRVKKDYASEKTFMLYSPHIQSIKVLKHGKVRRARLYYIRNLTGKKARIKERNMFTTKAKSQK